MTTTIKKITQNVTGSMSVKQALVSIFCDAAADAEVLGGTCALELLVRFAAACSLDLHVDASDEESHHAADCWNSVGNVLESKLRFGSMDRARELESRLESGDSEIPAKGLYKVLACNWDVLRGNTYTWRALAGILEMTGSFPNDRETRLELECLLKILEEIEDE